MNDWHVTPRFATQPFVQQQFASLDRVASLTGTPLGHDPLSNVLRLDDGNVAYYVKRYHRAAKNPLRRWLGIPRVVREWRNLLLFERWQIRTAELVAYGQERRFGGFVRGALVTLGIPATSDLAELALTGDPRLHNRHWVAAISRQLAQFTRSMHRQGFTHNDLKWRNILVDNQMPPCIYLIDCPNGAFWAGPQLSTRIVKDLACLDKVARHCLSATQRLRFYLDYAQCTRLGTADKNRIRAIVHYFKGRE